MTESWRTVRVFISSTFRDMHAERDHLVRFVFPRLREELLKIKIHLVDVDLRWGVTSDQDVLEVCRDIIDDCRPRFLCLLGGRYGWVPRGRHTSITAEEVRYAVLDRLGEHGYAYFYFRDPATTAAMDEAIPGEYREPQGSLSERKLITLKEAIAHAGLQPRIYSGHWNTQQQRLVGLEAFGEQVYADLKASIIDQFGDAAPEAEDEFAEEQAVMEAFMAERTEGYVIGSRQALLDDLTTFTKASGPPNILLLTGSPGSGKSALLAKCVQLHFELQTSKSKIVISHFIGVSPNSTNLRQTLRRFGHALATALGVPPGLPQDLYQLIQRVQVLLTEAASTRPVILILDALNQFDVADSPHGMYWLPRDLPPSVRIIVSTVFQESGEPSPEAAPEVRALRARGEQVREVALPPLDQTDARTIVTDFLTRYGKRLSSEQHTALLTKTESRSPLYLRVALEELRTLGTYAEITDQLQALPGDVTALARWIFTVRLSTDPGFRDAEGQPIGAALVSRVAALLGVSRYGLSQTELAALVGPQGSLGNMNALLRLLRPYLMRRGELLDFYHNQFREAAVAEYLIHETDRVAAHGHLANFFRHQADPGEDATWVDGQPRALRELPYHTYEAQLYDNSFSLARDEVFLRAQENAFRSEPHIFLETIKIALRAAIAIDDAGKMAEFSLNHAKRVGLLLCDSPLDALQAGNLQRAFELADLADQEHCILWHLLIAWELKDSGNWAQAKRTLERAYQQNVSAVFDWREQEAVVVVLYEISDISETEFSALCFRLLGDWYLKELIRWFATRGRVSRAITIAEGVKEALYRAESLSVIAASKIRMGDNEGARETLSQAIAIAEGITEPENRAKTLAIIAFLQAQTGDRERAQKTYNRFLNMPEVLGDEEVLVAMARAQIQMGDYEEARKALSKARSKANTTVVAELKAQTLVNIAALQEQMGDQKGSQETYYQVQTAIEELTSPFDRTQGLAGMASALTQIGHFAEALAMAERIPDICSKAKAFATIASCQAEAGCQEEARRTCALALKFAESIGWWEWHQETARSAIAIAQDLTGDRKGARQTCAQIFSTLPSDAMMRESYYRAEAFAAIASLQVENGDPEGARQTCAQALDATAEITDAWKWDKTLADIASAQVQAGDLVQALVTAEKISDAWHLANTLAKVATAQARTGNQEGARQTYSQAIGAAGDDPQLRAEVFATIVSLQLDAGDQDGARQSCTQALAMERLIEDKESRDRLLATIAAAQLRAGNLAQALATAERIAIAFHLARTLVEIAAAQAEKGDQEEALRFRTRALEATRRIVVEEGLRRFHVAIQDIVKVQIRAGEFSEAFATVQRVEDPYERAEILADIASAQAQKGDLDKAFLTTHGIPHAFTKVKALATIASLQIQAGDPEGARQTCGQALSSAQTIPRGNDRAEAFASIATIQSQTGDQDVARQTFGLACAITQDVLEPFQRAETLGEIAKRQVCANHTEDALMTTDLIFSLRNYFIPRIAEAFVESRNATGFKHLLVSASYYLDGTYRMIGLLARLYSNQTRSIVKGIKSSASRKFFAHPPHQGQEIHLSSAVERGSLVRVLEHFMGSRKGVLILAEWLKQWIKKGGK